MSQSVHIRKLIIREYLLADKKKRLTEIREKENQEYQAKRATI